MEVIKPAGELILTCPRCQSILSLHPRDIKDSDVDVPRCGCPVCSKNIQVPMNKIPKEWKKLIDWVD